MNSGIGMKGVLIDQNNLKIAAGNSLFELRVNLSYQFIFSFLTTSIFISSYQWEQF